MQKSNKVIIEELKLAGDLYKSKTVGEFFYIVRNNLHLTTSQFGKKIGFSRSMTNAIENNTVELKHKYVDNIAKKLMLSDPEIIHLLKLVNKQPNKGWPARKK